MNAKFNDSFLFDNYLIRRICFSHAIPDVQEGHTQFIFEARNTLAYRGFLEVTRICASSAKNVLLILNAVT
jgi:hypothetical protein